ncbi:MAG: transporter substrate-binding domain-containing protein [Evtepia sp.]
MIRRTHIERPFGAAVRVLLAVTVFCAFITYTVSVKAEESTPRTKLKVGFFQFDGYHILDADGDRSGYGYDLLQMLRSYANWEYQYIGYESGWPAMLPMLAQGELDLVTSVTMTPERLTEFDFSDKPIGYAGVIMTVKAGNERYKLRDYTNWNNMRVGIISGNSKNDVFAAFAKEKNFSYQEVPFQHVEDLNQALQDGSIDAAVSGSLRRMNNEWIYEQLDFRPFYIAVKKGNAALLSEVNRAIAKLEIEHPGFADVLFNTYYIEKRHENSVVYFSAEEQYFLHDILAKKQDFTLLVKPNNPPFWTGEDEKYHGILYDIFSVVKKRIGLNISILPVKSIGEYNQILAQGTPDFVLDMRDDFSYAEKFGYVLTDPYLAGSISIVTRRDFSGSPKNIGVIQGSDIETVIRKNNKSDLNLKLYSSVTELIEAVKNGDCDGCGIYTRIAENIILNDAANSLTLVPTGLGFDFTVGVNEKYDRHLLSVIRKGLQSISAEEMRQILLAQKRGLS